MCTISWLRSNSGYQVFFNRDEQRSRQQAIPPTLINNGVRALMPVDPQGGGSWCAVNEHGQTFALLNYYQGRLPKGRLVSRGQIVKNCALYKTIHQAKDYVRSLNLNKYAPFSLLCFDYSDDETDAVCMLQWNGKALTETQQSCPLISSAIHYEDVYAKRLKTFSELVGDVPLSERMPEDYILLHRSHSPTACSESICMHREDAKTVSFSQVVVGPTHAEIFYTDGSPCEAPLKPSPRLELRNL